MSLESEKIRLRQGARVTCRSIDPRQAERAALRLAGHILNSLEFLSAERVVLYAATAGEISTQPVFEAVSEAHKRCLFPRCLSGGRLEFAPVDDAGQLVPGRFGILEPGAQLAAGPLAAGDLVLVPGMAFDRRGGRVGRGGGYYDRAFPAGAAPGPCLMGVAHSAQLVDAVPVGVHDRVMDCIATELGVIRPA
ncbi:MAG: 5-formyltetrahydrofolate cyclo-ligase [bacterium]|nr:5-formyltetrahydrofolate cyclo-ligase [bacterium]